MGSPSLNASKEKATLKIPMAIKGKDMIVDPTAIYKDSTKRPKKKVCNSTKCWDDILRASR